MKKLSKSSLANWKQKPKSFYENRPDPPNRFLINKFKIRQTLMFLINSKANTSNCSTSTDGSSARRKPISYVAKPASTNFTSKTSKLCTKSNSRSNRFISNSLSNPCKNGYDLVLFGALNRPTTPPSFAFQGRWWRVTNGARFQRP